MTLFCIEVHLPDPGPQVKPVNVSLKLGRVVNCLYPSVKYAIVSKEANIRLNIICDVVDIQEEQ